MELLGPSLDELLCFCGGKFRMKTTLMIADQAISRIEHIHANRFIHRDLKPDNLAVGIGAKSNIIYLFDFGLAKQYKNPKTHKHIPYRDNKELTGTVRYASLNTHLGIEQARRDDLESLGFVFVYFLKGCLPWQGLLAKTQKEKYQKILRKMLTTAIENLCQGLPIEFVKYFQHVRGLKFEQKPDYSYLRRLLKELFYKKESEGETLFDWTIKYRKKVNDKKETETSNPLPQAEDLTPAKQENLNINDDVGECSPKREAKILEDLNQIDLNPIKEIPLESEKNKKDSSSLTDSPTQEVKINEIVKIEMEKAEDEKSILLIF